MSFDVVRFLSNYRIPWTSRGKNVGHGWVGVNCPFCRDSGYHGGFNIAGGYFNCWKCGGHSLLEVVKAFAQVEDFSAYHIIDEYGIRTTILSSLMEKVPNAETVSLPGQPLGVGCKRYLRKRGFYPDFVEGKYFLRDGGIVGDFAFRLIIPVFYQGKLVSYIGRDITGKQDLRYKNLPIEKSVMDIRKVLFNLDNCTQDTIIVVEGSFDAMKIGDNCCATLGTSVTEAQVRLLAEYKRVIISFDNEEPAQKKAKSLGERVAALGAEVSVVNHGWDHDMGSASKEEVDWFLQEIR